MALNFPEGFTPKKKGRPRKQVRGPSAESLIKQVDPERAARIKEMRIANLAKNRDPFNLARTEANARRTKAQEAQQARMQELRDRQNEPFIRLLSALIDAEPNARNLRAWASRKPNEWAAAISNLSRVVGYGNERLATQTNIVNQISLASDADLHKMALSLTQPGHTLTIEAPSTEPTEKELDNVEDTE